MSYFIY